MTDQATAARVPESLTLQEGLPLDQVVRRIGVAYASTGLRHRVVAFYLAELDARNLYQLAGYKSASRFAAARFGMSQREARELLAAGKALVHLPVINEAFALGKVCWSKVRELIKVASPQHETRWLELAQELNTDQLLLEVRLSKPGDPPRDRDDRKGLPEIRLRLNTALPPDVYAKWERARQKIQDESGSPLKEWEFVEALIDLALAFQDDGSIEAFYSTPDLAALICEAAQRAAFPIDADAAMELAGVSQQTPRVALRLLREVRREAAAASRSSIDLANVARAMDRLGIDGRGLRPLQRKYLEILEARGSNRPLGLGRLAVILGVPQRTLERVHEPYLFRLGLIGTTPHGRLAYCEHPIC